MSSSNGPDPTDGSGPKAKRAHTKSRNGCKNCKARKVKCDETRPLCKNCERHYSNITECEWADDGPPKPSKPVVETPVRRPPLGEPSEEDDWASDRMRILSALKIDDAGSKVVDPFNNLPPSEISSVDQFVRHYIISEHRTSFPFFQSSSITKAWWPFARDDIVLFHALLVLSDRKLRHFEKVQDSDKVQKMMAITIALLKERLRDPVLGTKDETIATVAHLAAIEHERGDTKALKLHLNGLKSMVSMRGGLDAFRLSCPLMANFTAWVALLTANDPFLVPNELKFDDSQPIDPSLTAMSEPLRFDFAAVGIPPDLVSAISDVDVLCQRFNAVVRDDSGIGETTKVVNAVTVTVQRCLKFAECFNSSSPRDALCCALAITGAIHLIAPVGGSYPDPSQTMSALVHKLQSKASILIEAEMQPSPLLFWLLYVGGVGTMYPPDREFFIRHLAPLAHDMHINDWATARETCAFVLWHAFFCESVFARLWLEVEEKMKALDQWKERMMLPLSV